MRKTATGWTAARTTTANSVRRYLLSSPFPGRTPTVFADARHIVEEITLLKTRVNGATPAAAAAAADPTE